MSVWLPTWSTDLVRRRERASRNQDACPLLLVASEHQRQVVARCCEEAAAAGVRIGMPLAQSRALFDSGAVRIEPHDQAGSRASLARLAVWAQRLSPVVAVDDASEGLLVDVTGCERVFGGEEQLARTAHAGLERLGFRSRIAIAPSFGSAWAIARYGKEVRAIVAWGDARAALSELPVSALRIRREAVEQLARVGIEMVGQLLAMPRSALPSRFGSELLLRLDQALGQAMETIEPVRPVPPPAVERVFDGPTDRVEAIDMTVRELLDEVVGELQRRACGAMSLDVELVRSDLEPERITVTLGRPSGRAEHLWALVHPKLERAHLGFGVEAVRLSVPTVGVIRHEQAMCAGASGEAAGSEIEHACSELLDTLSNRLGERRVLRAELRASHLPERSFARHPANGHAATTTADAPGIDRPSVLFDRPMPAEVVALTPDGPVHRVSWNDEDLSVTECAGPERIGGEWWRARDTARDYFAVRVEGGRWLWLVRGIESGRWFVHGVWA